MPQSSQHVTGLYTVIAIKLGKGILLLLVALGIYSLLGKDIQVVFDKILRHIWLNPDSTFFDPADEFLKSITQSKERWIVVGTSLYSLLLFVEGIGLIYRTFWAAWLAIGETAFFIPLEMIGLFERFSWTVLVILVVNVAVVRYLVHNRNRLFHHYHHRPQHQPA
jgi:uncharacterized membrane protein (DUF2068 family)